ncbi:MAG: glutamine amidotransferase [bacterium]|nr:glutamine amidotransferase [bacterium]
MELNIVHLYPDVLNLYGDLGNVLCLKKRCEWRGLKVNVVNHNVRSGRGLERGDIFFLGGGSDRSQAIVYHHLMGLGPVLKKVIAEEKVVLAICGGYQLLGRCYVDSDGKEIPGLKIFDFITKSSKNRLIGNIIIDNLLGLKPLNIVGFENHGGRTYHDLQALGTVRSGFGNNSEDKKEGLVYRNCIGTYMHGPLLPKNPHLADHLIRKALERKYGNQELRVLDDSFEYSAHDKVKKLYL